MDPIRQVAFQPVDEPLREDVGRLGHLVGELLVEQLGQAFYERIETLRQTAIARREGGLDFDSLARLLAGIRGAEAEAICRAFSTYFETTNIAEQVHRIRRRREYQLAGAGSQPEGLTDVLTRLATAGISPAQILELLSRLDVEPVLTAHPTEAIRHSLLEKDGAIVARLINGLTGPRTPDETAADMAQIRLALSAGWQTAESSAIKPGVQDEFDHVSYYLSGPLYRILPRFYETLTAAMEKVFHQAPESPPILGFGTWVGGDMDGNPHVDAATIGATLHAQRGLILERYEQECARLARTLSQTLDRVGVSPAVRARLAAYRRRLPEAAAGIRPRHRNMPYRCLLILIRARIEATRDNRRGGYGKPEEFATDIGLILSSLRAHRGVHAGLFLVRRLIWRIRSFGFHLARLDIRQHAQVFTESLATLCGGSLPDLPRLRALAAGTEAAPASRGATANPMIAVFAALAAARKTYGDAALGPCIISMAEKPSDPLTVLALARAGAMVDNTARVPLDIAPLLETVEALQQGPGMFEALFTDPVYRRHLAGRGRRQTIMLGYSDSGKEAGYLASRWALQRAQVELLEVARAHGVELIFFHGRGGSISRGGGKTSRAIIAAPRGSVNGRLRFTEQGEMIHRKYGTRAIALRTLEQTLGAVLQASLCPRPPEPREARWRPVMSRLAQAGQEHYRALVVANPDFIAYFRAATPIDVIEKMSLGSRPSRRNTNAGIASLRAIPWVFSWTQCRSGLPGWYGVAGAFDKAAAHGDIGQIEEMAQDWPFFCTLLEDLETLLAKTDMEIAARFSRLAGPLHARFFPRLAEEHARCVEWVLRLSGHSELLAADPRLALSIRLRNPYIDPMSLIQADLLKRWRHAGRPDGPLFRALVAGVNGIARGLQTTG